MLLYFCELCQTKKEEDWSDEEKKLVAEYEKKVKELNEEREKYRKVCSCSVDIVHLKFEKMLHQFFVSKRKPRICKYSWNTFIVSPA